MNLTELVKMRRIDININEYLNRFKIVRHKDSITNIEYLYKQGWLEFYQSIQSKKYFDNCDIILTFIGTEKTKAIFVGAYQVGSRSNFDKASSNIPKGFPFLDIFKKASYYQYKLTKIDFLEDMIDRLVIDWGSFTLSWQQLLIETKPKRIVEILQNRYDNDEDDEEKEYVEGKEYYKSHKLRERKPEVIEKAKQNFLEKYGRLFCEACKFDFTETYGDRGKNFIEGHHKKLVSKMKDGETTKIEDIAMLCSNCHRMIHREPFITVEKLAEEIKVNLSKEIEE